MVLVIVAGAWGSAIRAGSVHVHIYSGNFNLLIPANPDDTKGWMADAIIEVPHHLTISDLDAGISLTHTNVFDLQIFLRSPTGTIICLNMYDVYKEFAVYPNYTNTIFDDEALFSIKEGEPSFTGRFRPIEPYRLSAFDGEDSFGPWRLRIYDAFYADTGTLNSFELVITTPEPATVILLTLGAGLSILLRPRRT